MKKITFILSLFALCINTAWAASGQQLGVMEPFTREDSILILAPHPDDEALGCAGVIQQALAAGAKVKVAYLTNGDHNQAAFIVYEKRLTFRRGEFIHMGEVRRKEAVAAMKLLGLSEKDLVFLGYPDFGTFAIFSQYWQAKKPFRSLLTRISRVPYKKNLSFDAPYVGESILADLKKVIKDAAATKIFVTHPGDVNSDHKAFYLFLRVALADLRQEIKEPQVFPYLVHRAGWPLPRHYHPELSLEPPQQFIDDQHRWLTLGLTREQVEKKYQAILRYRSQTKVSAFYLLAFARKNELFGDCPVITIEPQASLKEKGVQFFGFTQMYPESEFGSLIDAAQGREEEVVSYAVIDGDLVVRIEKGKEMNRRFSMKIDLFGYSSKTPFAQMPKLRLYSIYNRAKIFEKKKLIKAAGASLVFDGDYAVLRLPLQLLGNPEFVLSSIMAYRGSRPFDATGFHTISIEQGGKNASISIGKN